MSIPWIVLSAIGYLIISLGTSGGFLANEVEEARKKYPNNQGKCIDPYCYEGHRRCDDESHMPKEPTFENTLSTEGGWIFWAGLLWPIVLTGTILFLISFGCFEGGKRIMLRSGKIVHWVFKEVTNPKENVKEVDA